MDLKVSDSLGILSPNWKNIVFFSRLYFCELLLNFGLCGSILMTFSLLGETGLKYRKRSINYCNL